MPQALPSSAISRRRSRANVSTAEFPRAAPFSRLSCLTLYEMTFARIFTVDFSALHRDRQMRPRWLTYCLLPLFLHVTVGRKISFQAQSLRRFNCRKPELFLLKSHGSQKPIVRKVRSGSDRPALDETEEVPKAEPDAKGRQHFVSA